jgi:molybdopterin-guanine dinucleotide biosynthesis protein A
MSISGIVLAGGLSRRMGGIDKGLINLADRPMIAHVLDRLAPQVDEILISANHDTDRYAEFGFIVLPDAIEGHAGPLAGLHRAMQIARHPLLLSVPCDSPLLPADLASRLLRALDDSRADLALARTGNRTHPVFSLCHISLADGLQRYLQAGGRKVSDWHATLKVIEVSFDDEPEAFTNINTPEDLDIVRHRLGSTN